MKIRAFAAVGLAVLSSLASTPALAARASINDVIIRFAGPLEKIKIPLSGTLGNASIDSLPLIANLKLPVISGVTVGDGINILQSVNVFSNALPGLGFLKRR